MLINYNRLVKVITIVGFDLWEWDWNVDCANRYQKIRAALCLMKNG